MDQEEKLEIGREIWRLCKTGHSRLEVLQKLAISVSQLEDCLLAFESRLPADAARVMEDCFRLDNERIEEVIECWLPIALDAPGTPDEVLAESDADFELRLRASYGVLAAIDQRHKIIMASQPERT